MCASVQTSLFSEKTSQQKDFVIFSQELYFTLKDPPVFL